MDATSSSSIISATMAGSIVPRVFAAMPDTSMTLSGASTSLSTAVTVTCPVLSV